MVKAKLLKLNTWISNKFEKTRYVSYCMLLRYDIFLFQFDGMVDIVIFYSCEYAATTENPTLKYVSLPFLPPLLY